MFSNPCSPLGGLKIELLDAELNDFGAQLAMLRRAHMDRTACFKSSRHVGYKSKWVFGSATARPKAAPTCATSSEAFCWRDYAVTLARPDQRLTS
jgi:hypothetical protein